jgi:hypothetical protein
MMEVLAHDIMRYETLSEPSDLFALASALVGNAPNDQYTVIELNVPKSDMKIFTDWLRTQALVSGKKNIPRWYIFFTRNKCLWLRSNMEFRNVTDIPAVELDSLLARFYLGIYDLYDLFSLNVKIMYITELSCL